ncbi:MAG: signal peptidase II [Candidatus Dactylopiibacterium carminicum]|uniref:Lipoprotein signal peptidase n=1 Tax=Candidatus Dactylopiibacterium carminicum TaxID=857335 RepID=A0A272EUY6_9RHOO|nr:signal peptidase II [Candidatus Dactylopiibacterium carminicum]KAF7599817.1 lipoprotein signal peptidase [Candidatus Dactylopiibacterium carminicum]PAS93928.1 MAG: signal peptidase II [Candidatus Dactylopiibacterium carminicum]PAS99819.1 MAG: signal peptidase II [Candidatus Dactylopiibacterium carminicum]
MKRFALWLGLSLLVIAFDQWSKFTVLAHFMEYEARPVTDFFNLVLVYNLGAAFSFLAGHDGWQRWFFVILAAAICSWLLRLTWIHRSERLQPSGFSLITGGAIGNVIDRLIHGRVVDFLDFHLGGQHWPAFNLADSAICLGVVLMLLAQIQENRREKQQRIQQP